MPVKTAHPITQERLEPEHIFRNQQVAGSIPAGGSTINDLFQIS